MTQTAAEMVQGWKDAAEREIRDGKVARAGAKRTALKLRALTTLLESDLATMMAEEKGEPFAASPVHVDALRLLLAQRPPPQKQQKQQTAEALPQAPEELLGRCYNRVMSTRSIAATAFGEAHDLPLALGFRRAIEQTPVTLADELAKQRLVVLQKDAARDPKTTAAHRVLLDKAGINEGYVKRKIDPLVTELAPYLRLKPVPAVILSLPLWERTAIVAASAMLVIAERVLDDSKRVSSYRNAQPLSQAGRFTKRALAKRAAAKELRLAAEQAAAEKLAARKAAKEKAAADKAAAKKAKTEKKTDPVM